ncbi:MAG: DJ-1/PfpI family protein [Thermoleophilaceae bacterium]|nr:DJ-1/PfpI family protein [Thermoleophilaceae bacterium]
MTETTGSGPGLDIALLLFDQITALDAIGPYEVLSRVPGAEVRFVASRPGPQRADSGSVALVADYALSEVASTDIVVIPGGPGTRKLVHDDEVLEWIRSVHRGSRWTASVCTGALLLGAAGILQGRRATTHWRSLERLRDYGAQPTRERMVEEGKIITAAGVSAGIDMALWLAGRVAGDDVAQAIQLTIEYAPEPPYDAGSPDSAPDHVVALARELAQRQSPREGSA